MKVQMCHYYWKPLLKNDMVAWPKIAMIGQFHSPLILVSFRQ